MITVTDSAVKQLQSILADEPDARRRQGLAHFCRAWGLRRTSIRHDPRSRKDGDSIVEREGVQVLVDEESAKFLSGSTIDFTDGLSGAGFRIQNPNAVRSCGCGTSFEAPEADARRSRCSRPSLGPSSFPAKPVRICVNLRISLLATVLS